MINRDSLIRDNTDLIGDQFFLKQVKYFRTNETI